MTMSFNNAGKNGLLSVLALAAVLSTINTPVFAERFERWHPRRDQVLDRQHRLDRMIDGHRGRLDGGYKQLDSQSDAIRAQAQADARANGGCITRQQQAQLNQEERALHRQYNQDRRGWRQDQRQ